MCYFWHTLLQKHDTNDEHLRDACCCCVTDGLLKPVVAGTVVQPNYIFIISIYKYLNNRLKNSSLDCNIWHSFCSFSYSWPCSDHIKLSLWRHNLLKKKMKEKTVLSWCTRLCSTIGSIGLFCGLKPLWNLNKVCFVTILKVLKIKGQ